MPTMKIKTILSLTSLCLTFFLFSCEKPEIPISFNFDIKDNFTIPAVSVAGLPVNLPALPVSNNTSEEFSKNGVSTDRIQEIKLEHFKLTITDPKEVSFRFLKSIKIYIKRDGMNEVLMAWKDDISDDVTHVLDLDVSKDNLSSYLTGDNFEIRIDATTDETTSQDYSVEYDIRSRVKAIVLGSK